MINTSPCTPSEAADVIAALWDQKFAIYVHGSPGCGKSSIIHQVAHARNARLYDVRLSQKTAADIGGLPALDHEKRVTTFFLPDFLPPQDSTEPSILFFDELSVAADDVKGAAYGIILERRLGDYHLPESCRVIAAGNRLEDGAIGSDLGSALSDRFVQLVVEPNPTDWLNWGTANSIAKEVLAFIHTYPQHLIADKQSIEAGHTIFPTPRSWHRVSDIMKKPMLRRPRDLAISGIVGDAVAATFLATADELANMASVETILHTPLRKLATVVPTTIAGLYALAYALTASVSITTGGTILDIIQALPHLNDMEHAGLPLADVQAFAATLVIERMLTLGIDCSEHPSFIAYDQAREAETTDTTATYDIPEAQAA